MAMKFGRPYRRYARRRRARRCGVSRAVIVLLVLAAAGYLVTASLCRLAPMVRELAQTQLEHAATDVINRAVLDRFASDGIGYGELSEVVTGTDGAVVSVRADSAAMNRLKSDLTLEVLHALGELDTVQVRVPLGNLTGSTFLSGLGPHLKIRVVPYGQLQVDFRSEFTDAGINQTRHEIYLDVSAHMGALLPGGDAVCDVATSVLAAQMLIVGDVPDFYAGR